MNSEENIFSNLKELSANKAKPEGPFTVPAGYFQHFTQKMMDKITDEETLSTLMKDMPKQMPYAVPSGYFSDFSLKTLDTSTLGEKGRVRNLQYNWRHLLAAAVTVGIIFLTSIIFYSQYANKRKVDNAANFAQQKIETMPTEHLKSFLNSTDDDFSTNIVLSHTKPEKNTVDFNQLFEKVSDKELKNFLDETDENDNDFLIN